MKEVTVEMQAIPSVLFKYFDIRDEWSIKNLALSQLYYSDPLKMNDPFELGTEPKNKQVSPIERSLVWTRMASESGTPLSVLAKVIEQDPEGFAEREQDLRETLNREVADGLRGIGLCCFSETCSGLRLWAHYADGGRGFCLEFDVKELGLERPRRVTYCDEIPELSILDYMQESRDVFETVMASYVVKAKEWESEKEWRAMSRKPNIARPYKRSAIKAVLFGLRCDRSTMRLVKCVLGADVASIAARKAEWDAKGFLLSWTSVRWEDL